MKLLRQIVIAKCKECPYLSKVNYCNNSKRKIKNTKTIPDWCKLQIYNYVYFNKNIFDEYGNAV